jgi:hypothetical protein
MGRGRETSSNVLELFLRLSKVGWHGATVLSSVALDCQLPAPSCPLASGSLLLLLTRSSAPLCCCPWDNSNMPLDLVTALTVVWRKVSMGFPDIHRLWAVRLSLRRRREASSNVKSRMAWSYRTGSHSSPPPSLHSFSFS